jgi:hypothetical protein
MSSDQGRKIKSGQQKPPHFPFEDPPFRLSMGLLKIPEEEWFEIYDLDERAFQMSEKRKLLAERHDEIFMADPSADQASKEILNMMVNHLPAVRPDLYSRDGDSITLKPHKGLDEEVWPIDPKADDLHPLDLAARLVQEDLIIMVPPNDKLKETSSGWRLAAGSLAFPSRWSLQEKFGQPMDIIHAPVPFYKEQLQNPVDNFFNQMSPEDLFTRRNWAIHDEPTLHQNGTEPIIDNSENPITKENAGNRLWLRVERQTLRKLNNSGAILFTIRIHLSQFKDIVNHEGAAKRLAKALASFPSEMHDYKRTDQFTHSAKDYLDKF